ncbi:hypothetical protein L3X38_006886 [Prunus dulcis]|uniref:Uncharacterized protein n=1 Tax=Prunus dulcis TaxID=3755 RepID=A0AAD4ZTE7_PRUDU|nr:hypothetical protein L3X38_006886 [Prunus dulcis]
MKPHLSVEKDNGQTIGPTIFTYWASETALFSILATRQGFRSLLSALNHRGGSPSAKMVNLSLSSPFLPLSAVPQDLYNQEEAGEEDEAEQAHPSLDPFEDRQHHQVQRQAQALAPHQARFLRCFAAMAFGIFCNLIRGFSFDSDSRA